MLAVDTNILVSAHRREVAEHDQALERIRALAEGAAPWAIPWPCVYEFFSVVTNPRIWKSSASSPAAAWAQVRAWTGSPQLRVLGETEEFLEVLQSLLSRPRVRGAVVHDARVAALWLAHGVEALLSRDRDFSLFPELNVEGPLG
ncbi:MAG: TA system VapC family ribonuclease toxin [Myxococcota bacterium]